MKRESVAGTECPAGVALLLLLLLVATAGCQEGVPGDGAFQDVAGEARQPVAPVAAAGDSQLAEPCPCQSTAADRQWCDQHQRATVAGVEVPSQHLFEALDAHGHDVDPQLIRCDSCRRAMATDGFCQDCRMGFLEGRAFLSSLSFQLAIGRVEDPASLACPDCRHAAEVGDWCERCDLGRVGSLVVVARDQLPAALAALAGLHSALSELERCENCAVARFTGGACRFCNLTYADGTPQPLVSAPRSVPRWAPR